MTEFEARVTLGLREDDPISVMGLETYSEWLEEWLTRCQKYEKPRLLKEAKAVQKLLRLYG